MDQLTRLFEVAPAAKSDQSIMCTGCNGTYRCGTTPQLFVAFYRAMHYSAKRGLAIACRLSVCPSVTLVDHDHTG